MFLEYIVLSSDEYFIDRFNYKAGFHDKYIDRVVVIDNIAIMIHEGDEPDWSPYFYNGKIFTAEELEKYLTNKQFNDNIIEKL